MRSNDSSSGPAATAGEGREGVRSPAILVWWIIWATLIVGVVILELALPREQARLHGDSLRYLPILPLFMSCLVRWIVLPRFDKKLRAFPFFIIGLSCAEGGAILGIFLVPDLRDTYVLLGLLGLIQFQPYFAKQLR